MAVSAEDLRQFQTARPRLFALAYRMLGSAAEAEDAIQDAFLRWEAAERTLIRIPDAWLTKVLANLCVNRLTSARATREKYVGPWLPEPVLTDGTALGPLETAEQRELVSLAVLVLLERLSPSERAVFVLREAFGYAHREIAEVLPISESNSQQLYKRARSRLGDARPRFDTPPHKSRQIAATFLAAAADGKLAELERLLADDVIAVSDGGGKSTAARQPILGAAKVARYLGGWLSAADSERLDRFAPDLKLYIHQVNAQPAFVAMSGELVMGVQVLEQQAGRITAIRTVINPDKLVYITRQLQAVEREPVWDGSGM